MSKRLACLLWLLPLLVNADSYLFFLEIQGVGGWSGAQDRLVAYSHEPMMLMQKPSLGFDFLQRFSSARGDWGSLAAQFRLAWNAEGDHSLEPQIYNLFFKYKSPVGDFWLGHNRPAFALAAFLDTHGQLIQTLAMESFGFERDWGLGLSRDTSWGNLAASLTLGSGQPLAFHGNYLLGLRGAWGVLERDNISLGLSLSHGRILPTMGWENDQGPALPQTLAALDVSHRFNRFDNRLELMLGRYDDQGAWAGNWLGTVTLDGDERWKLQSQVALWNKMAMNGSRLGIGLSWQASSALALRTLAYYEGMNRALSVVVQVYYYKQIWL